MRTVHKFKLTGKTTELPLSPNHQVLHVAEQDEEVTIWIELYTDEEPVQWVLHVVGTGWEIDQKAETKHVGSCLMQSGLVWHVYEGIPS